MTFVANESRMSELLFSVGGLCHFYDFLYIMLREMNRPRVLCLQFDSWSIPLDPFVAFAALLYRRRTPTVFLACATWLISRDGLRKTVELVVHNLLSYSIA